MFVIIGVLFFVTTSYLDVIKYYTTAGGSYVVARDNFGPKIAQIAAVALLIDYTVTVAVQCSAGTAALTTAFPDARRSTSHWWATAPCDDGHRCLDLDLRKPARYARGGQLLRVSDLLLRRHAVGDDHHWLLQEDCRDAAHDPSAGRPTCWSTGISGTRATVCSWASPS